MQTEQTQVAIIGAGPAGLILGHLLHQRGIDSVILERRDRDYVIERVRAGVLEQGTVDLLREMGLAERLDREGMRHEGLYIAFDGTRHRIDLAGLTGGRAITIYGQNEVVRDLIEAREATGRPLYFNVSNVSLHELDTRRPFVRYIQDGTARQLRCDFVAGCDGFHGVSRRSVPEGVFTTYERGYPFAWLGILAQAPPTSDELVYSLHDRGFALFSMRSPAVTRLYLQVDPDENLDDWSDDRIWNELLVRLRTSDGWEPAVGPIFQKGITPMRSFVVEPMRYGRLFLAGDAAHIVPPTGARGLNSAASDIYYLYHALVDHYKKGDDRGLDAYSQRALARVWKAQRFSWWMTVMLHTFPDATSYEQGLQRTELEYLLSSEAALASLAENYVGLPF